MESFNIEILDKLTNQGSKGQKSVGNFFFEGANSKDGKYLRKMIVLNSGIILISLFRGFSEKEIDLIQEGFQSSLHLLALIFSLYALVRGKRQKKGQSTFGELRWETVSGFSNCLFLILSSLFLIMESFHSFHDHHSLELEGQQEKDQSEASNDVSEHSQKIIYLLYVKLVYTILGLFIFSEYSLFLLANQIPKNLTLALSGISQNSLDRFGKCFQENLNLKQFEGLQQEIQKQKYFASHFENMHGVFLTFLTLFIFQLVKVIEFHLDLQGFFIVFLSLGAAYASINLTKPLLISTSRILLNGTAIDDPKTMNQIKNSLLHIPGIIDVKSFQCWNLNSTYIVCNTQVQVNPETDKNQVRNQVYSLLEKQFQEIAINIVE